MSKAGETTDHKEIRQWIEERGHRPGEGRQGRRHSARNLDMRAAEVSLHDDPSIIRGRNQESEHHKGKGS